MKLFQINPEKAHQVERFGSQGFGLTHLSAGEARLSHATLAPGGRIGRHPATQEQLLLVVEGGGQVNGRDGIFHPIKLGQAALWQPGEEHETRTEVGMTLLLFEGDLTQIGEQLEQI